MLRFYLFNPANSEPRGLVCVDPANRLMIAKMKILLLSHGFAEKQLRAARDVEVHFLTSSKS